MHLADVVRPSPERGRAWVDRELARPEYNRESWLERLIGWFRDLFDEITHVAGSASPFSTLVALVLGLGLVGLIAYVVTRVRREAPGARVRSLPVLDDRGLTAAELRSEAESALREGRHEAALTDGYRALVLRAVETAMIEASVGSTAHELAERLTSRYPDHSVQLRSAADLFDAVVYGGRPAGREDAESMLRLDETLIRTRPAARAMSGTA